MLETDSMMIDANLLAQLRRFVRRRVRDPHDAQDLVQDVLTKLHEKGQSLADHRSRLAWTLRVARNAIIDHYRRRKIAADGVVETLAAPSGRTLPQQEMKCVRRMLKLLPEESREALILADEQEMPQHEIARRYGISLSGAKSRVQRARRQLREMVLDCCEVEFDARGGIVDYQPTERAHRYCDEPCAA